MIADNAETLKTKIESVSALVPDRHQAVGVEYLLSHHYCLLADEQGVGKTYQALVAACIAGGNILIVCPASLVENWKKEIVKCLKAPKHTRTFKKQTDPLSFQDDGFNEIVILTYDQVKYANKVFLWADTLIADECQRLKNESTHRYIFFEEYLHASNITRLILASGTPMENRVEEIYTMLTLLSATLHPTNGVNVLELYPTKTSFCEEFSYMRKIRAQGRTRIVWDGLKNVEKLRRLLDGKLLRRKSEDVQDLPPICEEYVCCSYGEDKELLEAWEEHNQSTSDKVSESKAKRNSALLKTKFTCGLAAEKIEEGERVVIFSDHVDSAKAISDALNIPCITGETSPRKRDQLVGRLQAGEISGLSCTIGSASVGFTMTISNYMIMNDISWVPAANDQARKRIHRRGQDRSCKIVYVIGSVQDEYIVETTRKKMAVIKNVLDFKEGDKFENTTRQTKKSSGLVKKKPRNKRPNGEVSGNKGTSGTGSAYAKAYF